ncbi:carbon-nitrogen hydrolase family protein [Pseudohongiella sp.]|uniref:CN hydrolase domain-containing protein n=1 Tax=marine sediment metagenome TaxID=412755 RepID=A0A0F9WIX7_9ZZZZ|nr:carbon-nitrogen hydrolase family protein [Pseudohongiella sp.]HDZ07629.1 carbon-nitrogen hydrolase family protein [Pseudohongiella sp.]HEA63209.1 carbon-nitrogen hydrolase family protein [Pseudohongiella sp.]
MVATRNRVAAVQMVSTADIHGNIEAAGRLIGEAAAAGAALVVLPENFAVLDGGPQAQFAEHEGDMGALLQGFLSAQARRHGIDLVAGTIPLLTRPARPGHAPELLTDGRVRPASLVFDSSGAIIARYDKMHLFDVEVSDRQARYAESDSFEAGNEVVAVDTTVARLGLSICYDMRFPELYRRLFNERVELISVPAAFTRVTGEAHWEVLLRARAIENQCYVIGAGQGGVHNERRETYGHSMIIDPWGRVLDVLDSGEGVVVADLDLPALHELRRKMPVFSHRRL